MAVKLRVTLFYTNCTVKPELKQSLAYAIAISVIICCVLFLIPIELFDGEITYRVGAGEVTEPFALSLSYFIGIGYDPADLDSVVGFHLTARGIITALIFIVGIPGLIGYRIYLQKTKE
jgi:hypothetical protein